jgi:RNA polymerase sigma-70 factor (ECF subfamily)
VGGAHSGRIERVDRGAADHGIRLISETVERIFREETGRIAAGLIRRSGSFDLAEEALQDAFASALETWPCEGVPRNPAAWITKVAYRKLIDRVRREKRYAALDNSYSLEAPMASEEFEDDRLRLIFTCCHPALNQEAQVALTLRTLGGLTTTEIARAFLIPEATLAQRLVRAKRKITGAGIPYQVPGPEQLHERLDAVRSAIYLIFNEGYTALRGELSAEGIRLGRMLDKLMPARAENLGLLALMLLQESRRAARVDAEGRMVLLEEQDRSLWDRVGIAEGVALLDRAIALGASGPYQVQAAIAALHTQDRTDWRQIAALYGELLRHWPTPVVALNGAVAVGMSEGPEMALALLAQIRIDGYYLYDATRADFLRRLGRTGEAAEAYRKALALTENARVREYLEGRLREMEE